MPRKRSNFIWQNKTDNAHLRYAATLDFARKLRRAMAQKHMSQSDLARECWGEEEMASGFFGARGRDRINKFVQGKALPDPETLATLAKHLGVPESELSPTVTGTALEREYPELRVTQIANHRDLVHLTMDTVISLDALHAILTIYKDAKTRGATEAEHRTHGDPYASLTPEQWEAVQVLLAVDRADTRATRESIDTPEAQEKPTATAPPKRRGRPPRATQRLLRETA